MSKVTKTTKATSKSLGKSVTWGIAILNSKGKYELLSVATSREVNRAEKRRVFNKTAKVVKIVGNLELYTK